jgi:hypothetical protein
MATQAQIHFKAAQVKQQQAFRLWARSRNKRAWQLYQKASNSVGEAVKVMMQEGTI